MGRTFDSRNWSWLRLAALVGSGAAAVVAVLVPAAAGVLVPISVGLGGVALQTPGFIAPSKLGKLQGTPPFNPEAPTPPPNPIPPEFRK